MTCKPRWSSVLLKIHFFSNSKIVFWSVLRMSNQKITVIASRFPLICLRLVKMSKSKSYYKKLVNQSKLFKSSVNAKFIHVKLCKYKLFIRIEIQFFSDKKSYKFEFIFNSLLSWCFGYLIPLSVHNFTGAKSC